MGKPEPKKGGPGVRVNVAAIKAAREAKGWSQAKLAHEIGSEKRVIERIESRGTAALKTIADIAEVLGVTPGSLRPLVSETPSFSRGVFQLPPSLPDFTGRADELARITARLRSGGTSVGVSSALRGMGGIGKTVTAVEACWEVKDDFPDGQLVVELRGMSEQPLTPVQAMSQIIRDFHPETSKLPDDEKDLLPLYRRVLTGKKALVLLDDAKDEAQVRNLLSVPPVAFVVTSRNALALDGVESIRLGVLPPDEALTLLRGIVGTKGTDDELRTVTQQCERLPLALRVAGDFLRLHENWPLPKYIEALRDESKRLERLKGKTPDRDVEAVLGLSARELVRENAELAGRWQILSVFPSDFNALAAAAVWDLMNGGKPDASTAVDELTALLERSLLQFDADTDRYSLHDLMRPIAREVFGFVEEHPLQTGATGRITAAERRFAGFYRNVLAAADNLYLRGNDNILNGLALFDREESNIRHGHAWAVRHCNSDQFATECCRDYSIYGPHIISLRLSARERIAWLQEAIVACQKLGDRQGEAIALGNLGLSWQDLGESQKAITSHEQKLVIARELGDRRGEAAALGNLGLAWYASGDAQKAITLHEQSLAIDREIGNRRGEATALGNLGLAWQDLGESQKAIAFHEQRLVIARELGDRRGEAIALSNWGSALCTVGETQKAIVLHEQALVRAREIGDRRGEANVLVNLGRAWGFMGDLQKATAFYSQGFTVAHEAGDQLCEATAAFNISLMLHPFGKIDDKPHGNSINLAEHALQIFTEIESSHAEMVRQQLAQWRSESAT